MSIEDYLKNSCNDKILSNGSCVDFAAASATTSSSTSIYHNGIISVLGVVIGTTAAVTLCILLVMLSVYSARNRRLQELSSNQASANTMKTSVGNEGIHLETGMSIESNTHLIIIEDKLPAYEK